MCKKETKKNLLYRHCCVLSIYFHVINFDTFALGEVSIYGNYRMSIKNEKLFFLWVVKMNLLKCELYFMIIEFVSFFLLLRDRMEVWGNKLARLWWWKITLQTISRDLFVKEGDFWDLCEKFYFCENKCEKMFFFGVLCGGSFLGLVNKKLIF